VECRCNEATEFTGDEATRYAEEHLVEDSAGVFNCPDTGARWSLVDDTGTVVLTRL
jgi:hypothetical protein